MLKRHHSRSVQSEALINRLWNIKMTSYKFILHFVAMLKIINLNNFPLFARGVEVFDRLNKTELSGLLEQTTGR